jgi:hypothetical protein
MIHITVLLPEPSDLISWGWLLMLLLISAPRCAHRFFFCFFFGVRKEPFDGPLPIYSGTRCTSQHKSLNMAPSPKIEACFGPNLYNLCWYIGSWTMAKQNGKKKWGATRNFLGTILRTWAALSKPHGNIFRTWGNRMGPPYPKFQKRKT